MPQESTEIDTWKTWVGQRVWKKPIHRSHAREPKPFKSGLKVNTATGITTNPHTGRPAFTFAEDESLVDCCMCSPTPDNRPDATSC